MPKRCDWVPADDPLYQTYHDEEWGVPVHDDRRLFEMLILEGAQAGLSWRTILRKRDNYRAAFDGFDPVKIAGYGEEKIADLLGNEGIVRNKLKIRAAVQNARAFLQLQQQYGSFDAFIWQFVDRTPIVNAFTALKELPAKTAQSDAMSKALRRHGFTFVGSTICYAFMQAVGMVNDHQVDCFRYHQVQGA